MIRECGGGNEGGGVEIRKGREGKKGNDTPQIKQALSPPPGGLPWKRKTSQTPKLLPGNP